MGENGRAQGNINLLAQCPVPACACIYTPEYMRERARARERARVISYEWIVDMLVLN